MALILNLETATTVCSVALARDGEVIECKEVNKGYTHAENLTIFIQEIFTSVKIKLSALDAIAVSKGPGSYTGLRIGVSTAKGLCMALDKPLIAIHTLQAMAVGFIKEGHHNQQSTINNLLCPMLDARRMEVYCAAFDPQGKEVRPTSALVVDENSFSDLLAGNRIIFFGDGAEKCKSTLMKYSNAVFMDNVFPSAKNMTELSEKALNEKRLENVAYFEPFYLKDFVAGGKQ